MKTQFFFLIMVFCINITAISQCNNDNQKDYFHIIENWQDYDFKIEKEIIDVDNIKNLEIVDVLFFSNSKIINFQNIIKAENLERLYISDCFLDSSFEVISELKKLKKLTITFCKLADINFLGKLKSLEYLYLYYNNISDNNILKNLSNLISLDLRNNNISDITSLTNLSKLLYLNLRNNNISDFSPINNLVNLTNLITDRSCDGRNEVTQGMGTRE